MMDDESWENARRYMRYRGMSDDALDREAGQRGVRSDINQDDERLQGMWRDSTVRNLERNDELTERLLKKKP